MKYLKSIFITILIITFISLFYYLNEMYLFRNIYVLLIVGILVIISILLILGLFKIKNRNIHYIIIIFMLLIIGINSIGIYCLEVTDNFFNIIDNKNIEYEHYYLLSLKDKNNNNKNIGVTINNKNKVTKFIKDKINIKEYSNITDLITGLYVEEVDLVLVNDIEKYVWQEYDEEFFNKII